MDDRVIEAEAEEWWETVRHYIDDEDEYRPFDAIPPHLRGQLRISTRSAIRAADEARAEAVKAAVDRLVRAEVNYAFADHFMALGDGVDNDAIEIECHAARRDLFALLNIGD